MGRVTSKETWAEIYKQAEIRKNLYIERLKQLKRTGSILLMSKNSKKDESSKTQVNDS